MNRSEVLSYARSLVNTKYNHEGRCPGVELDCIGLLIAVARKFKYPHKDLRGYSPQADGKLIERLSEFLDVVKGPPLPCDIPVTWEDRNTKLPQHVSIINETGGIIHASVQDGKVVEVPVSKMWNKRVLVYMRFRGITD